MPNIFFQSGGVRIAGNLLVPHSKNPSGLLILHGAGYSHKEKFIDIQKAVLSRNIASLAIDFTGVGESGGAFADGSLAVRLQNATDALEELKKYANPARITILGSSMGGFIAAVVGSENHLKNIILLAAAAYNINAEDKKLNEEFTNIIRKPNSWENSRSFTFLEKFSGRVLVLYGENDKTIPDEIKNRYRQIASRKGEWYTVTNAGHNLITPENLLQKKAIQEGLFRIGNFLTKT